MGMKIGLSYGETVARTEGELLDLMACYLIARGTKQKALYDKHNFMELMRKK